MAKVQMNSVCDSSNYKTNDTAEKFNKKIINDFFNSDDIEVDEGYEAWYNEFQSKSPEEQQKFLYNRLMEIVSDEDKHIFNRMVEIIRENPDKNTDLLFITDELKKEIPDVQEGSVFNLLILLMGVGEIGLDNN